MVRSIFKTVLLALTAFGVLSGCDSGTSSNGGGGAPASVLEGQWSRTTGTSVENVNLTSDGKGTLDSLNVSSTGVRGRRYSGTWTASGTTGSVTWTSYSTTTDGVTWSTPINIATPVAYPIVVSGVTGVVTVNGVERTYTKGIAALPTTEVVAPTIAPSSGTFTSAQSVVITTPSIGGVIYYTTDGSTPTTSSSVYSGPITVSATKTIKAITSVGSQKSSVTSVTITIDAGIVTPTGVVGAWQATDPTSQGGMTFDANGKFSMLFKDVSETGSVMYGKVDGTYSTSGNAMNLTFVSASSGTDGKNWTVVPSAQLPPPMSGTYSISGTTLVISMPEQDGTMSDETFTKVTSIF